MRKQPSQQSSLKVQSKGKKFKTQKDRIFKELLGSPATMLMLEHRTGINRSNICRFIAKWRKQGVVHCIKKGLCAISKYQAGYYTTDKSLFPITNLKNYFNHENTTK